jgi:peptidoglycan/xylan/chitin deacetylase (PgdA/CDA1 family)
MHINGRGRHTAEALPAVIEGLRKRGFRFVMIGELFQKPDTDAKKR